LLCFASVLTSSAEQDSFYYWISVRGKGVLADPSGKNKASFRPARLPTRPAGWPERLIL